MTAGTPFQAAQAARHEVLRRTVLDAAGAVLVERGPQALTMRRLAGEIGCSTTVLYTMFGNKDGLADALYQEGFERLSARLVTAAAGESDPLERLAAIGRAYRANALAERSYYGVMFAEAIPGFTPSEQSRAVARSSLRVLTDALIACADAGMLRVPDPDEATDVLWAAAHGVVSLEQAGHYPDDETAERRFRALTGAAVRAYAPTR